jgi:hypothetical protein
MFIATAALALGLVCGYSVISVAQEHHAPAPETGQVHVTGPAPAPVCEADWVGLVHTPEGQEALLVRLAEIREALMHLQAPRAPAEAHRRVKVMHEAAQLENLVRQYQTESKKKR